MIKFLKRIFGIKERAYATVSVEKELENVCFTQRT